MARQSNANPPASTETKKRERWTGPTISNVPKGTSEKPKVKLEIGNGTDIDDVADFVRKGLVKAKDEHGVKRAKGTINLF